MKFDVQQLNDNDHGKLETKSVFLLGSQHTVSTQLSCLLSSCLFSSTWRNGLGLQFGLLASLSISNHESTQITYKLPDPKGKHIGRQRHPNLQVLLFRWLSTYCANLAELCVVKLFVQLYLEERPGASVWVAGVAVHFPSRINSTRFHHKKNTCFRHQQRISNPQNFCWTKLFFHHHIATVYILGQ